MNIYAQLLTILLMTAIISWSIAIILSFNFVIIWMISFALSTVCLISTGVISDL